MNTPPSDRFLFLAGELPLFTQELIPNLNLEELTALSAFHPVPEAPELMIKAAEQVETIKAKWFSELFVSDCGLIIFSQKHLFIHRDALLRNPASYPNLQSLRHNRTWFKVPVSQDDLNLEFEHDEKVTQMVRMEASNQLIIYFFCSNKNNIYSLTIDNDELSCYSFARKSPLKLYGGYRRTGLNFFNVASFEQSPVFWATSRRLAFATGVPRNVQDFTAIDTRLLKKNETITKLCIIGEHRAFYTSDNRVFRLEHQPGGSYRCELLCALSEGTIQDMELTAETLYLIVGQYPYEYNNGQLKKINIHLNEDESVNKIIINENENVIFITNIHRVISEGPNPLGTVQPNTIHQAIAFRKKSVTYFTSKGIFETGDGVFFDSLFSKIKKSLPILCVLGLNLMKAYYVLHVLEVFYYIFISIAALWGIPAAFFLGGGVAALAGVSVRDFVQKLRIEIEHNRWGLEVSFLIVLIIERILSSFCPLWISTPVLFYEMIIFFGILSLHASDDFSFIQSIFELWAPVPDKIRQRLFLDEDSEDEQNAIALVVD
jgi:hypothetical protein